MEKVETLNHSQPRYLLQMCWCCSTFKRSMCVEMAKKEEKNYAIIHQNYFIRAKRIVSSSRPQFLGPTKYFSLLVGMMTLLSTRKSCNACMARQSNLSPQTHISFGNTLNESVEQTAFSKANIFTECTTESL